MIAKQTHSELSIYKGELTTPEIIRSVKAIKQSFPTLPNGFYDIFTDRIKGNDFNDERLKAAVAHVIDNCIYPTPTIAQFISFDKNIKLYNYAQMMKLNDELNGTAFKYYKAVRLPNAKKPMYAALEDINEYKLKPWNDEE